MSEDKPDTSDREAKAWAEATAVKLYGNTDPWNLVPGVLALAVLPKLRERDEARAGWADDNALNREQHEELLRHAEELAKQLKTAELAIATLDDDTLGTASVGDEEWPVRDEVLSNIRAALSSWAAYKSEGGKRG